MVDWLSIWFYARFVVHNDSRYVDSDLSYHGHICFEFRHGGAICHRDIPLRAQPKKPILRKGYLYLGRHSNSS